LLLKYLLIKLSKKQLMLRLLLNLLFLGFLLRGNWSCDHIKRNRELGNLEFLLGTAKRIVV